MAQPALGLQIRSLEQELRVPLLMRHSRGITPTEAGRVLFERACHILRVVEETKKELLGFGGPDHENIAVGLTPGIMKLLGKDLMMRVRSDLPEVRLSLLEELSYVLVDALERNEIDIAVAYEVPERAGLFRIPIIIEELLLVTAPVASGGTEPISFARVLERPLAMATERDTVRQLIAGTAERLGFPLQIAFEASSVGVIKTLVASGEAASVMPYASAIDELRRGELQARRIVDPSLKRTLYLVRSSRRKAFRSETKLLEVLRDATKRLADELGPLAARLPALDSPFAPVAGP